MAPGDRAHGFGGLRDVGVNGFSWSSTVSGSNVRFLDFNYGFLARMASKTPDGRGFPLRCLQE